MKKIIALLTTFILTLVILFTYFPETAFAYDTVDIVKGGTYDLCDYGSGTTFCIRTTETVTLEQSDNATLNLVKILGLVEGVTLILNSVNIENHSGLYRALEFNGANNILLLMGDSYLGSGLNKAGIRVAEGTELTIHEFPLTGGSLNVMGGVYGAGIGGDRDESGGTITIQGGTINADTLMRKIFSEIDQVISLEESKSTLAAYIKTATGNPLEVMERLATQATEAHEMFLADMYKELKLFKEALKWQNSQISETKLNPFLITKEQYLATAAIECDMATAYDAEGSYNKALQLAGDALGIFRTQLGKDHPYVATALHTIASVYDSTKAYSRAVKYYKKSINILEEAYIPDHPAIAMGYSNLGISYNGNRKYKKALDCYKTAGKIYEKTLGDNKSLLATLIHNKATVYDNLRCFDKSLESYEQALKIYDAHYGKMSLKSATTICNIGLLYDRNQRYDEAVARFNEALEIREAMLGPDHYETARLYADIAMIDLTLGEYDKAREGFEKTAAVYEKTFGRNNFETQMLYARIQECKDKKANFG